MLKGTFPELSEQFTQDLLQDLLQAAFPTLRVEKTELNTNPICYD